MSRYGSMTGRKLYRSRNGIIFGVCRGVADFFDFSVFWVRVIAIGVFVFTGFWPIVGVYILAALLMKRAPALEIGAGGSQRTHGSFHRRAYAGAGQETAERLKRKWRHLEKRIRRMEDRVTSREFDWNNRFFS